MKRTIIIPPFIKGLIILFLFFFGNFQNVVFAQKSNPVKALPAKDQTDTGKVLIHVLNNDYGEFVQGNGQSVQKLMNNVKIRYGSDTLYCDSAFFYVNQNNLEAFGDVAIYEADGTKAFADYMRYTSGNQSVFMRSQNSDVELDDGKGNILWSKEITYRLTPKIGFYTRGGTLQSGSTIVSSGVGTYNLKTKDAHFTKKVIVSAPQYYIQSSNLGYNTVSKIVTFFDTSTVKNDSSILKTRSGFYNTIDSTAHFTKRAAIWNGSQFIEADTLDYSHKEGGLAVAKGHVIVLDTAQHATLFSQTTIFNEHTKHLFAYGAPLLRTIHGKDSLYIKADTFFSAPATVDSVPKKDSIKSAQESLQKTANNIQAQTISADKIIRQDSLKSSGTKSSDSAVFSSKDSVNFSQKSKEESDVFKSGSPSQKSISKNDTALLPLQHQRQFDSIQNSYHNRPKANDTSAPRYFIGYHHVRIFSDSLQGYCDSIRYSQTDSLLRMYVNPLLWPNRSQVAGKEIYLKLDSSHIKQLIVPEDGILINRSGPEKAGMFNQIQGNTINGYFKDNQLHRLVAEPHASSIYYVTNDAGEYIGCSEANSRQIEILFDTYGSVNKIFYRQNVTQKMTPMKDVQPEKMRLSRFQWHIELKFKDLNTFLKDVSQPSKPVWEK